MIWIIVWHLLISATVFAAVYLLATQAWPLALALLRRQQQWYEQVLVQQLLLDITSGKAIAFAWLTMLIGALVFLAIGGTAIWFIAGAILGGLMPNLVVSHLQQKRRQQLDHQLLDGVTTLASGVRAGLNIIQSVELLVRNSTGPIKQEFSQLLREYQMGLDLGAAMRNAADRIGSSHYRLLLTALGMHRRRGGDVGHTLDSLAESIREIQRLEGKLDALTAQGRTQARMMAAMPIVLLALMYLIEPDGVSQLFIDPLGRIILAMATTLVAVAFWWIRRIMAVDI